MTAVQVIIAVVFAAFAVSYGWGMRGTIIGGEKGALLPGALLGVSIALFAANGVFASVWHFFAAAGALSMFYGGIEPYAQTMSHIMHRDGKDPYYRDKQLKGGVGIFIKGGLWFGISALILSLLPQALAGEMSRLEIIILFALIPVLSFLGVLLFNSPYQPNKGKLPKLYFSKTSREEWGGNLLVYLEFLIYSVIKKNYFALGAGFMGLLFGGLGFLFGLLIYDYTVRRHKGKYLFGSWQEKHYIDGWKIMEHFFGAFAGGGVMLWFCLNSEYLTQMAKRFPRALVIHNSDTLDTVGAFLIPALLLITALQYLISRILTKKTGKEPDVHIFELAERPLISAIPLIFVFMGGWKTAFSVAFLTIAYVLCEKCAFEWFSKYTSRRLMFAVFAAAFIVCTVVFFTVPKLPLWAVMLLYTAGYTVSVLAYCFMPDNFKKKKQSGKKFTEFFASALTVYGHFVIQCVIIMTVILIKT